MVNKLAITQPIAANHTQPIFYLKSEDTYFSRSVTQHSKKLSCLKAEHEIKP